MEVAVLADVHGNAVALRYVLEDLKKKGICKIVILGDIVMKGPMPAEALELLKDDYFEILAWVKGNTELWLEEITPDWEPQTKRERELFLYYKYATEYLSQEQLHFLEQLPQREMFLLEERPVLCVHGTPKSIMEAFDESVSKEKIMEAVADVEEDIILGAHSHTTYFGKAKDKIIFNPGSIGNSLEEDKKITYGILKSEQGQISVSHIRLDYPVEEIIAVGIKNHFPLMEAYKKLITKSECNPT